MKTIDRWLLRITLPVIAAALAWQTWIDPSQISGATRTAPDRGLVERASTHGRPAIDASADPLANRDVAAAPDTRFVPWSVLRSYQYQPRLAALPPEIRSLEGQRVTMAGFLLPLYEFENIREFALVGNHWSCCYDLPPALNGLIKVQLQDSEASLANTSDPLRVVGTFRVREELQDGHVVWIYAIEGGSASVL